MKYYKLENFFFLLKFLIFFCLLFRMYYNIGGGGFYNVLELFTDGDYLSR